MAEHRYLLNHQAALPERLAALSAIFDPWSLAHLDALGVGAGARVWEVGAGGPSTVSWLAERVGPKGSVLATDIDISWLASAAAPNVEVRRHDVGTETLPGTGFDLVHARLVLVHVSERHQALHSMIQALRPGGWLLVEDADPGLQPLSSLEELGPQELLANRIRASFRVLLAERGADLAFGRTLAGSLRRAGLRDVAADAYLALRHPVAPILERATISMLYDQLVATGLVTGEEIDRHLGTIDSGDLDLAQPPLVSAWGRTPTESDA